MKEVLGDREDVRVIGCTFQNKIIDLIRDYINGLSGKYAGISHIDLFCNYIDFREFDEADPFYSKRRAKRILRKWMVGSIKQWMDDIPNEVMLTLVQPGQTIDIEKLCQFIIPEPLIDYSIFARQDDASFDLLDAYTRRAFVIHDELFPLNENSIDTWRMVMSSSEIMTKPSAGKLFSLRHKRISIPMSTTRRNQENGGFLQKSFGFRRFGCLEIDSIDNAFITAVDVNLMWAEAFFLYQLPDHDCNFNHEDSHEFLMYNAKYMI
jgi:hypothetical protein